jgi:hypothetical protein
VHSKDITHLMKGLPMLLKTLAVVGSLTTLVTFTTSDCLAPQEPHDPCKPTACVVNPSPAFIKVKVSDGIWVVGTEVLQGRYTLLVEDQAGDCVWFVNPATDGDLNEKLPSYKDGYAGAITIRLKDGESFTVSHCGAGWTRISA